MPQTPRFVRKRPQGEPSKGNHSASTPDETSAKVSRLAAITSVSAFLATGCLVFAAVTSLMNLFEAPTEALEKQLGLPRAASVAIIAVIAVGVGVFLENGDAVSTWMDVVSIYIMPVGALLAGIMFFWVCPKGFAKSQAELGHGKPLGPWFDFMTKYVFIGVTIVVIILGIFYGGIG